MSLEVDIRKTFGSYSLDVSFTAENEVFGLLGASGCGKSLTMRSIAGIETPDEGRIVVNGQVFFDGSGELTRVREALAHYPEDVRRKKLAGHLLLAAQAGQYNYSRCLRHGETAAAQLAVIAFAQSVMEIVFLLNDVYQPFYKWRFRAMRALPKLPFAAELVEYLITTNNDGHLAQDKYEVIEDISADIIAELEAQGLTAADCVDLEKHAYSVNDGIADGNLRNLHILAGV